MTMGLFKILVEHAQDRQRLLGGVRVQVPGGLVGEDQVRIGDERAGDGDALFLAARGAGRG